MRETGVVTTDDCSCHETELRHGDWQVERFTDAEAAVSCVQRLKQQHTALYWAVHLNGKHVLKVPDEEE